MPVTPSMLNELHSRLIAPVAGEPLAQFLIDHSNLPGPRGNLELIDALAAASTGRSDLIPLLSGWLRQQTLGDDPAEYLSAAAAVALGAIFVTAVESDRRLVGDLLRAAANDPRWRIREGVAMGLQRIGEAGFAELDRMLREWLPCATLLEQRAIVAALAHPPMLKEQAAADVALALTAEIATNFVMIESTVRKTEQFKVLKQGLSYAISVIVAATPERGFTLLGDLIDSGDKDARAVVKANLGKNRLAKPFPGEVARLLGRLAAG